MPNVALYTMDGTQKGTIELNETIFGAEINKSVLHQVVVNYLANQRQGTQSTKTRTEVRGGGVKPWKQKGTGRARQGSIRSPQWVGGGVALGPKPRDYRFKLNKKVRRVAMLSALSAKVAENEMIVVDNIALSEIKTKAMVKMLADLNVTGKALIVLAENDNNVYMSARNIRGIKTSYVGMLNVYDLLKYTHVIFAQGALEKIEEVYA